MMNGSRCAFWLVPLTTLAWLMIAAGCANTIIPPANVSDPQTVYLLDFGRHSSLVLPNEDDTKFTEFAYGEWAWYALQKDDSGRIFPTLFIPTEGTLGRNTWALDPSFGTTVVSNADREEALLRLIRAHFVAEDVYPIVVERHAVADELHELNARYDASGAEPRHVPEYRMYFVPDRRQYTLFHNCNHEVVAWLRELGCTVKGSGMFADFVVKQSESFEYDHKD